MGQRFYNPFPQFFTDTPTVREGARLFFYEAGSSTKLDTYPTSDLSGTANPNPIELNEYGYPPVNIYLQDRNYKIVLAPAGSDDPPDSTIWTADNYRPSDFSIFSIRKVGSGSPNGNVAGTAGSSGVLPTEYWDYTNSTLYICTTTGGANDAVWTAINVQSANAFVAPPQGYLSASSSEAILTSDAVSATSLTYHRFLGEYVPIYNGSVFTPTAMGGDLTLTMHSTHAINTLYDVFVFSNSGVLTLVTGPAWSVSTAGSGARGTGAGTTELQRVSGIWTNKVSMTGRNGTTTYSVGAGLATYIGTILIDGTAGQITCHATAGSNRQWKVWNAYNQQRKLLVEFDSTSSWTGSTTVRASRGSSANAITVVRGLPCEIEAVFRQILKVETLGSSAIYAMSGSIGIGVNSTSTMSGQTATEAISLSNVNAATIHIQTGTCVASHSLPGAIGADTIYALEGNDTNSALVTRFGAARGMRLTADFYA